MTVSSTQRQSEAPEVKTYDQAKAVELTKTEQEKVSREMLLNWFEAKEYEKLKGLQDKLITLTVSEREKFKKRIIENTKKELEAHRELTDQEKNKRAEKFAEALIKVVDGVGNVKTVIEDFENEVREENLFHHYVGSVGGVVGMLNLRKIKEDATVKKFMDANPAISEEFDTAIESGEYDSVKDVLLKIPEFQGQGEEIDTILDFIVEQPGNSTGIMGMIGSVLGWAGGMPKKLFDTFRAGADAIRKSVYRPVAKKMGVEYSSLRSVGSLTFIELSERNRIMQQYKHLLEERKKITPSAGDVKKLDKKLKLIDDVKIITENIGRTKDNYGNEIYKAYEDHLQKLQKEDKISAEDVVKILSELNLDSVRVETFLPLVNYEEDKDRKQDSNVYPIGQIIARQGKIRRALKVLGGDVSRPVAHGMAGISRIFERNTLKFKKTFSNFPDGARLNDLFDDLSRRVGSYNVSPEELSRTKRTRGYMQDLKGHDDILRMYYHASHHASQILSKEAQRAVNVGKQLDGILGSGKFSQNAVPKNITDFLYPGGRVPANLKPDDLLKMFNERMVDIRIARDTAQESFAVLSRRVNNEVMGNFQNRWFAGKETKDFQKAMTKTTQRMEKTTQRMEKYIHPGKRALHYGGILALPVIAIGAPIVDAIRRKSHYRDIKWDLFDTGISFVPVAGTINDFKIMWKGRTTSGRKLGIRDRALSGFFGVVGAVSDAALLLGGLGGVMRAGVGSLRAGKNLAHVGKLSKAAKGVQTAEGVTFVQRMGGKVAGLFSTAKRAENYAESAAKIKALDYMQTSRTLEKVKDFDKVTDLQSAEVFAKSLATGSKEAQAAKKYVEMMKNTRGLDYYKSLSQNLGYAGEIPRFMGARKGYHETMNYLRRFTLGKHADRLKEMDKTADLYQAYKVKKAEALVDYQRALADGKDVSGALKRLRDTENSLVSGAREYAKIQEEAFILAEKLSRAHRLSSTAAKYMGYSGLGVGAYMFFTNSSPTVQGIADVGKKVAGAGYDASAWALDHATSIHNYEVPVDDLVEKAISDRKKQLDFASKIKEIEDGQATDKKLQIQLLCAKYWNNDFVRVWAMKHKDKLDLKKIMDDAKNFLMPQGGRMQQVISGGPEFVGEGGGGGELGV